MPSQTNGTRILSKAEKPVKELNKPIKAEKTSTEKPAVYIPNIPEPTCRAELIKYWINLSLDDKTANRMLWISEGGSKVTRRTEEVCPVLDRPERYECSPQVLCKEGIWNARCYWEVEYTGWAVVGATYEGAGRRSGSGPNGLGENNESWGVCWAGTRYQVWSDGVSSDIMGVPFCSTIGVYADQPAGLLCYYIVTDDDAAASGKEVRLLHKMQAPIQAKLMPGFWVGQQSAITLLKKPEEELSN